MQEVLDFLTDLKANNNREWFADNKHRHDAAREQVIAFTAEVIKHLSKTDPKLKADTDPRKCVLRIYRDIRFSADKTPYKKNFGISLLQHPGGGRGPEYYIQIEPGKSFVAGGYWMPESAHLKAIRQEIDYNAADLKQIVEAPAFVKLFGDFAAQDKLKTVPKGYSADNENIEWLKLKSFIAVHYLTDAELVKKAAAEKAATLCAAIHPLNVFLNNALA